MINIFKAKGIMSTQGELLDDSELIKLLESNETNLRNKAFSFLVKRDFSSIENLISNNSGNYEDAKDVFQDGLIVLFNNINKGSFKGKSSIKSYLYAICKNLWYQQLRKNKKLLRMDDLKIKTTQLEDSQQEEKIQFEQQYDQVKAKFRLLGNQCQEILIQFYYQNKSMKELQEIFQLGSSQAAKNKKSRCLKKLISLINA